MQFRLADGWHLSKPFGLLEPNSRKGSQFGEVVEHCATHEPTVG
jgi:hypothetical protein